MTNDDSTRFLPYGRQAIDQSDIDAVVEVLRSDYLTTGPAVAAFEAALAARLGVAHAVSCSSGTSALHLACAALGLGPGQAAIVPSLTFLATANAVRMVGAEVVFADVDPDSGLMRPQDLDAAFARARAAGLDIRAVLPVHLAGPAADMIGLAAIAERQGAAIIEDACHALGTEYPRADGGIGLVGDCALSRMAVLSFHPVKTVVAGEGGAVTTNDPELARRLASLRSHGMTRDPARFENRDLAFDSQGQANPWYYEMPEVGWNYRLSDIHAALASRQLARLDEFAAARRSLVAHYDARLDSHPLIRPIARPRNAARPVWHLYAVLVDFAELGLERGPVMRRLAEQRIGTQVHYIPVHRQPYYAERYPGVELPGADAYYRRTLSLPLFVGLTPAEAGRVVDRLEAVLDEKTDGHGRTRTSY